MENAGGLMTRHDVCPRCRAITSGAAGVVRLEEYVDRIAQELHERVEHQHVVLRNALHHGAGRKRISCCPWWTARG